GEAAADDSRRGLVNDIEQRTVQRILTLLTPLVGAGNVRAQVSADVDFAQREQTSETYRPNQKPADAAIRSEQTSDSVQNNALPPQGVPGALTNQPPLNATAPIVTPPAPNPAQQGQNQANQNPDPGQAAAQTTQPNVLASNGTLQQGHG